MIYLEVKEGKSFEKYFRVNGNAERLSKILYFKYPFTFITNENIEDEIIIHNDQIKKLYMSNYDIISCIRIKKIVDCFLKSDCPLIYNTINNNTSIETYRDYRQYNTCIRLLDTNVLFKCKINSLYLLNLITYYYKAKNNI